MMMISSSSSRNNNGLLSLPIPILERITEHVIAGNNDAKLLLHHHPLQTFFLERKDLMIAKIGNPKYLDTYYGLGLSRVNVIGLNITVPLLDRLFAVFPGIQELSFSYCHFECQIHYYPQSLSNLSFEYCTGQEHLHNLPKNLENLSLTGSLLKCSLIDHLPAGIRSLSLRKMLYIDSGLINALTILPNLSALDLSGTEWLSVEHLHTILNHLPHLHQLTLFDCPQLTSRQLEKLQRPHLRIQHNCKLRDDSEEAVRDYLRLLLS